jgi:hypothetical protein
VEQGDAQVDSIDAVAFGAVILRQEVDGCPKLEAEQQHRDVQQRLRPCCTADRFAMLTVATHI